MTDADARDAYIPVRKAELIAALAAEGGLAPDAQARFRELCRVLAAVFHYEYFERLEALRDAYFPFDPDTPLAAAPGEAYAAFEDAFFRVLTGANFVEVTQAEIDASQRASGLVSVKVKTPTEGLRRVRFFRRGRHSETARKPKLFGLRHVPADVEVYDNVVVLIALDDAPPPEGRRRPAARPGAVLLKYFKNIGAADLNMLYPNVRVVMSNEDKLLMGVPALAGGIPILLNLIPALSVLFLVAGFYLGIVAAIEDSAMKRALAAMSGLVALGGFLFRQWMAYERRSLKYQKQITDNVYFRNVNNNAGMFDYLIGAAEEQECKEAFLAYHALLTADAPLTKDELDARVERWISARFGLSVDFEVHDALGKLERLGLLRRTGERLQVVSMEAALAALDRAWDGYFSYAATAAAEPA